MITIDITYTFKNGITCTHVIKKDVNNPISKVIWSCEMNKKNLAPLIDEYISDCLPFVYQKISNLIGQQITWIDKSGRSLPVTFIPDPLTHL